MRPLQFEGDWSDEASTIYLSVVSVVLIAISGLCAGLTLALLSLDSNDLEILKRSRGQEGMRLAESVMPFLKKPHVLLVSLLLVNSLCMEALPLCLDRLLDPVSAIVISVTVILLFGEIIPQAVCKKYGLRIASSLAWLVKLLIVITYPVSFPISKVLDALLGSEDHALFRRTEIEALIDAHVSREGSAEGEQPYISRDEAQIVHGALKLYEKNISDSMTPIDRVFKVDWNDVYDEQLLLNIIASGHSRIPICVGEEDEYKCLLVKELLLLQQDSMNKRIRDIEELSGLLRDMPVFLESSKKIDCINHMMNAMRHMALVMDSLTTNESHDTTTLSDQEAHEAPLLVHGKRRVIGILTLEDLLEDLLVHEIVDETDMFKTNAGEQPLDNPHYRWKMSLIQKRRQ